jgi:hypothetical protein
VPLRCPFLRLATERYLRRSPARRTERGDRAGVLAVNPMKAINWIFSDCALRQC